MVKFWKRELLKELDVLREQILAEEGEVPKEPDEFREKILKIRAREGEVPKELDEPMEQIRAGDGEVLKEMDELREQNRAMAEKISELQGEIRRLNAIAACTCGGVSQAPAQTAPPVMGNGGMQGQGQGQGTMLLPVEVTDHFQAGISKKKKKRNRNKIKKEKKNELDLLLKKKNNALDLPVFDSNVYQKKIGRFWVSDIELGRGSNGTIVLKGMCDGRKVAVKRVLKTHTKLASKEINNYIGSPQHSNVVSWYGVESDENFHYLALERCSCTLDTLIQPSPFGNQVSRRDQDKDFQLWNNNGYPSPHLMKLIRDMVHGLLHLHEMGIVHRDLKPSNVLILKQRKSICAKLSDMGISKRLADDMSSVTNSSSGRESSDWQAPEQLSNPPVKLTRAVDIFSLGCVIFFAITKGKRPFGERMDKNNGVLAIKKKLQLLDKIPEAHHLVDALLNPCPEKRPSAADILRFPFFWDSNMRLSFIRDASNYLGSNGKNVSKLLTALDSVKKVVFTGTWDTKLDANFLKELGGKHNQNYNYHSFRELLRAIRNKWGHYEELSKGVQQIVGNNAEGCDGYFSSIFPNLLIEVYKIFQKYCQKEDAFLIYFGRQSN